MENTRAAKVPAANAGPPCVFCGGCRVATTEEHCPPRALFRDKQWPEGYVFPACEQCNHGTSDADLLVAFVAHLDPAADDKKHRKTDGLMRMVNRQAPELLSDMVSMSAVEARANARRLGLKRDPGQTYQELGVVNIPEDIHLAVSQLAAKLTKAVFYKQTGNVFPALGGIMFQWFTGAQMLEHGSIVVLDALSKIAAMSQPVTRNGQNLVDQFDYSYSVEEAGGLHLIQAVFGAVFGFVSIFSQEPGRLEAMHVRLAAKVGSDGPFIFLSPEGTRSSSADFEKKKPLYRCRISWTA